MKTKTTSPDSSRQPYVGAPIDSIKRGRTDLFHLAPEDMIPAELAGIKLNTRTDFGDLEALADSLIAHGCKEVLRGHMNGAGKFEITNGERRWRAASIAVARGHAILLPCRPEPRGYSDEERICDLFTCNNGKPLTFIEEARTIQLLSRRGLTEKEIAEKTTRSTTHIANCLALVDAGEHILSLVESGRMSATLAIEFIQAEPDTAKQIAHLVEAEASLDEAGVDRITAKHLPIKVGKARQAEQREQTELERTQQAQVDAGVAADQSEQERLANLPDDPDHQPSDPFEGKDCTETSPQTDHAGVFISGIEEKKLAIPFPLCVGIIRFVPRPDGSIATGVVFKFPGSFECKMGLFETVSETSPTFPSRDHALLNGLTRMHEQIVLAQTSCVDKKKENRSLQHYLNMAAWFEEEIGDLADRIGGEVHLPKAAPLPTQAEEPPAKEEPTIASLVSLLDSLDPRDCVTERRKTLSFAIVYLEGHLSREKLAQYLLGVID